MLSAEGHGALMVIERETGLEQIAETGVMIHGDLSADLLRTIFSPQVAAPRRRRDHPRLAGSSPPAPLLPLGETTIHSERFGTRHRAALGTTEQTDAIVVVVSEENGQVSLVQRARIVRNLNEAQLARALRSLLEPSPERAPAAAARPACPARGSPRLADLGRAVRPVAATAAPLEPLPPDEPLAAATPPTADGRDDADGAACTADRRRAAARRRSTERPTRRRRRRTASSASRPGPAARRA